MIHSLDPDTDTLKCTKCGALWRAKGDYDFDLGGWNYEDQEDEFCPCGCRNFIGLRIRGDLQKRKASI